MVRRSVIPIDKRWVFRQADKKDDDYRPVSQFPTNVHLDLMHHGMIADPFVGKNENDVQWVGEEAWIYKTTFVCPELHGSKAVLAFHGLDTYATVVLNGKTILETDNMFVPERVDVTKLVRSGNENELQITFDSAFLIGKKLVEKYPNHHWGCWNGDPSRLAVRKAQYHYVSSDSNRLSGRRELRRIGMGLGSRAPDVWTLETHRTRNLPISNCGSVFRDRG